MKKDQSVIACLPSPADAATVLPYARECAKRLGKALILLNVSANGQSEWLKDYGLPYIGLKGDWKTAIEGLPAAVGGVLVVTPLDPAAPRSSIARPSTLLRTFAECKTAYIALGTGAAQRGFGNVALSIDHRRESKEKLIWGSYLVRFFGSRLTGACPDYRDEGLRHHQTDNLRFLDKMYSSLGITYSKAATPYSAFTTADMAALETLKPDMLIALATDRRDRDLGDWLGGAPELRLLRRAGDTPVLLINQRDDLYVLCD